MLQSSSESSLLVLQIVAEIRFYAHGLSFYFSYLNTAKIHFDVRLREKIA